MGVQIAFSLLRDCFAFDSYGEALVKAGRKQEARLMYQKSIELNPKNEGGQKALGKLEAH